MMTNKNIEKGKKSIRGLMIVLGVAVFALGFLTSALIYSFVNLGVESPSDLAGKDAVYAPHDFVSEDKIQVYNDRVVIKVSGASLSSYAPTGSMKPLFDSGANGIRIVPKNEEDIHIGDIISFKRGNELIVHRVAERGFDENGLFFITRGDNNSAMDEKIRFSDIKFLTIGVVY
jgi:hypothetical protein